MITRSDFKYNIGEFIKDNIVVTNRYRKRISNKLIKIYDYECLICGNKNSVREYTLKNAKYVCNVCQGKKVLKGFNDIATTHPEYCKYFVNKEDTFTHSQGMAKKVLMKCLDCGNERMYRINDLIYFKKYSCPKCGDGISFPEKIMFNVLSQLYVDFEYQKKFTWSENKYYDFYISDFNMIIETHGNFHYNNKPYFNKENINYENDILKKENAISNHIKNYVVIDCRVSSLEFIKNNILNSCLSDFFNLSDIDWEKCYQYALKSLLIDSCNLFKLGYSVKNISLMLKIGDESVRRYLKKGTIINLCKYKGEDAKIQNWENNRNNNPLNKEIYLIKKGETIGLFKNAREVVEYVQENYNIKLFKSNISKVCNGKLNHYKQFKFRFK